MKKLLKHKWEPTAFLVKECKTCGCIKQKVYGTPKQQFYFRSGTQLSALPECKRTMHSDKTK